MTVHKCHKFKPKKKKSDADISFVLCTILQIGLEENDHHPKTSIFLLDMHALSAGFKSGDLKKKKQLQQVLHAFVLITIHCLIFF